MLYIFIYIEMNSLVFYDRQKSPWSSQEESQLKTEYVEQGLSVIQIADIHKRTPGVIGFKLKSMNIVNHHLDSRGYDEYKKSILYQEIIQQNGNKQNDSKNYNKDRELRKSDKKTVHQMTSSIILFELQKMNDHLHEINTSLKELVQQKNKPSVPDDTLTMSLLKTLMALKN